MNLVIEPGITPRPVGAMGAVDDDVPDCSESIHVYRLVALQVQYSKCAMVNSTESKSLEQNALQCIRKKLFLRDCRYSGRDCHVLKRTVQNNFPH